MIKTFSLSRLPNPEYVQFMDYVLTLVSDKNPTALNVKPQFDLFSLKVTEMKDIFKTAKSSPITEQIVEADNLRDQSVIGLTKVVDGYSYHFDDTMKESSNLLQRNIVLYGRNMVRENMDRETALIESLVNDWQTKPELQNAMETLGLVNWITQLKNENTEFKRLYALRNDAYSQQTDENMQSKRVEVNAAYEDLSKFLNSYSVINSTNPDYEVVISGINSYADHYTTLIKQTRSRKKVETPAS